MTMGLSNYAEQILNIYNYYNGAIMVNRRGMIEYYYNNRKDINTLTEKDVLGKSLFEIYSSIDMENSTLMEVMRTGQAMSSVYQSLVNFKGEKYGAICSTFPIFDNNKIIGAIEIFLYLEERDKYMNIFITGAEAKGPKRYYVLDDIISVSRSMNLLKGRILRLSDTDSTVMIYRETGTGKELVAQAIHANGRRSGKRFLSQNCAAIPENLLESILFGTVRGGYTDAENRMGLFEAANGGTLFLDEINSMDISVQAKILKAIEEQQILRIGGLEEIPIDVRVIAAMNADPWQCVEEGLLREDLYYRLKVVQLNIPPLRDRKEDILPLTAYYLDFFNRTMQKQIKDLSDEVKSLFFHYQWPGNVRELRNMIESGFNLCEGEIIEKEDIDINLFNLANENTSGLKADKGGEGFLKEQIRIFERKAITDAIKKCDNLIKAADCLGISRQTLNNKMKELEITEHL